MTKEEKIYSLIVAGAQEIKTTNEYATGKNYETNIGQYYQEWMGDVNPESAEEVLEVRDFSGDVSDEQEPLQHEFLEIKFVYGCKNGSSTAAQLRKAKADIYRMIGKNLDYWRAQVDGSLKPVRGGWEKNVTHGEKIFGEITVTVIFQYIQEPWLVDEKVY